MVITTRHFGYWHIETERPNLGHLLLIVNPELTFLVVTPNIDLSELYRH